MIDLETFASGDTDYIAKMNSNVSELTDAINRLESQMETIAGTSTVSIGMFLDALFNQADALIGPQSYAPTLSVSTPSTLIVAAGGMYLHTERTTVAWWADTTFSFIGRVSGTYYVKVLATGIPLLDTTQEDGTIYSVDWSGSELSNVVYIAPIFYDTREADASRKSSALWALDSPPDSPPDFVFLAKTLDDRLEAGEALAVEALEKANAALGLGQELESKGPIRKIGCTVDATVGVKGAIQIDFDGAIIGWSIIADVAGSIQVEVDVKASADPPAAPAIPNTTTDKISASAPIQLTTAQSAARDETGVASWTTVHVSQWDVIQFNVASASTLKKATLYLRIQEIISSPPVA